MEVILHLKRRKGTNNALALRGLQWLLKRSDRDYGLQCVDMRTIASVGCAMDAVIVAPAMMDEAA